MSCDCCAESVGRRTYLLLEMQLCVVTEYREHNSKQTMLSILNEARLVKIVSRNVMSMLN